MYGALSENMLSAESAHIYGAESEHMNSAAPEHICKVQNLNIYKAYALTGETPEPFPKDYNQNVTIH